MSAQVPVSTISVHETCYLANPLVLQRFTIPTTEPLLVHSHQLTGAGLKAMVHSRRFGGLALPAETLVTREPGGVPAGGKEPPMH